MENGTCQPFDVCPGIINMKHDNFFARLFASNSISPINDVKAGKILSAVIIAIVMQI